MKSSDLTIKSIKTHVASHHVGSMLTVSRCKSVGASFKPVYEMTIERGNGVLLKNIETGKHIMIPYTNITDIEFETPDAKGIKPVA